MAKLKQFCTIMLLLVEPLGLKAIIPNENLENVQNHDGTTIVRQIERNLIMQGTDMQMIIVKRMEV